MSSPQRPSGLERRKSLLDNLEEIAEVQRALDEGNRGSGFVVSGMGMDDTTMSELNDLYDEDSDDEGDRVIDGPVPLDPLYENSEQDYEDESIVTGSGMTTDNMVGLNDGGSSVGGSSSIWERSSSPTSQRRRSSFMVQHEGSSASFSISSAQGNNESSSVEDNSFDNNSHSFGTPNNNNSDHRTQRRRSTITKGSDASSVSSSLRSSRRRQNLYRPSISGENSVTSEDSNNTKGSLMQSIRTRTMFQRRSTKRNLSFLNSTSGSSGGQLHHSMTSGGFSVSGLHQHQQSFNNISTNRLDMAEAVHKLGSSEMNSNWENVAAAAAVVAASAQAPANRGHVQFSQDDNVLVLLTLLNVTNQQDEKDLFTVDPVNEYGYPVGGGRTEAEKQGPHTFVLCAVTKVHFDEDERYYTVTRADTESDQRADPGWMEPIKDSDGLLAAFQAAKRTTRSMAEKTAPILEHTGIADSVVRYVQTTIIPFYARRRSALKKFLRNLLHAEMGYRLKCRISSINFLVLCSFFYLFIEVFSLAFLPASMDHAVAVAELAVWCILLLELVFEFLIRPSKYSSLVKSDRAFAPSTARHINHYHLFCEAFALILFFPQFRCVVFCECGRRNFFSGVRAAVNSLTSESQWKAACGRMFIGFQFLRAFGLVRHWKQMWINHTIEGANSERLFFRRLFLIEKDRRKPLQMLLNRKRKNDDDADTTNGNEPEPERLVNKSSDYDQQLKNAATTGTALLLVNSHRVLFSLIFVVTVFPTIYSLGQSNTLSTSSLSLLHSNNIASNSTSDCDYLENAIQSWLKANTMVQTSLQWLDDPEDRISVYWAQLLPKRCDFQREDGVITVCPDNDLLIGCRVWNEAANETGGNASAAYFAEKQNLRVGGLLKFEQLGVAPSDFSDADMSEFYVSAIYNANHTIALVNASACLHMFSMLVLCLVGLTVMRGDAGRLVLDPLQRMLKIVVRYAENPLQQNQTKGDPEENNSNERLGKYETEQLVNAIAKIADLLRKCWGVAGAGIISSNLARTKDGKTVVFNPTVPGTRVYALFGFIAINDFDRQLRALDRSVMILINDVARVVHDEVYRWAHGDSGQCNKNLGAAFLMVFRIGNFSEVHDKKKRATDVVFSSQIKKTNVKARRRKSSGATLRPSPAPRRASSRHFDMRSDGTLHLASLPGIQSFADRALLGCLKSFAGIHRDTKLKEWSKDFRLGAGVGAFTVSVIYGMDAGWAVEGAVGSEYKIDATYLSPHVNMASRMMSACRQYNVTILLSHSVQELLSKPAQSKLRHLDTVYVKGSNKEQRVYTYDARYDGVDFFLHERTPDQADVEAEAYSPAIWEVDQDLRAMRQHISDEFVDRFKIGVEQYHAGEWKKAIKSLRRADDCMIQFILEEGFVDYAAEEYGNQILDRTCENEDVNRLRNEFGDGPCKCLLQFMERRNGIPPQDWHGVRHLTSK